MGRGLYKAVPCGVPAAVVAGLEVVQVDEGDAEAAPGVPEHIDVLIEAGAVPGAGERVGEGRARDAELPVDRRAERVCELVEPAPQRP